MIGTPEIQNHYGVDVITQPYMDALRKTECLCLNCSHMEGGCQTAQDLYEICKRGNMALAVTRCPQWHMKRT